MDYSLGMMLKTNMMMGLPSKTKSKGDYQGSPIPPNGDYSTKGSGKVPRPPWLQERKPISLDEEIRSFVRYMEPTPEEVRMRTELVQRFTKLVTSFNIDASIEPVGSYVTGLYLPTSDIDMVITFESGTGFTSGSYLLIGRLSLLIRKIRGSGFASKVDDVLHASVPLIRITDKITGIEIDLTASDTHAIKATEAVQEWLLDSSPAKPLLFVVKMFLTIRRCGKTYTGGINSYALFWMVIAWVKLEMPKNKRAVASSVTNDFITAFEGLSMSKQNITYTSSSNTERMDLGELLIKFLKFYAEFDCYGTAIHIKPTPAYRTKTYGYSRYPITQRYLLSIYDPADISDDMGSKAYGIKHIQASFKSAYQSLDDLEAKRKSGKWMGSQGVLGEVLGGDFTTFLEKRRLTVARTGKLKERLYRIEF